MLASEVTPPPDAKKFHVVIYNESVNYDMGSLGSWLLKSVGEVGQDS
jgi:hypothetical protein